MAVASVADLVEALCLSPLLLPEQREELKRTLQARFADPKALARELMRRDWLTPYQANQLLQGKGYDLLLGSYIILERLGEGGMGRVYKARNWKLGRVVALKVIRQERLANQDAVRRFRREIQAAAQLDHPNIVRAFDADQAGDTHFFVMEHVAGTDLKRLVEQRGPLPVAEACDYVRQAALGLQHAHERGLVHRDIKPSNLLLAAGVVKLLDLGLVRLAHRAEVAESASTLTEEGWVVGTPDYLAPEQASDSRKADIRSDLYSLGCTCYFLLAGQPPFPYGSPTDKVIKHAMLEPQALAQLRPEVPPAVTAVVRRLLAKRPEDRFQTPAELAATLAALPLGPPAPAPQQEEYRGAAGDTGPGWSSLEGPVPAPTAAAPRAAPRRRWPWLVGGGTATLPALVLLLVLIFRGRPLSPPATVPQPPNPPDAAAEFERWCRQVAALTAPSQVDAVTAKLRERNPGFKGDVKPTVENGAVTGLEVGSDQVSDIAPVRALPKLKTLKCHSRILADLSPLRGLSLTSLDCGGTAVADLSPLKGMPLNDLRCPLTKVTDLSPLRGSPLTWLDCAGSKVTDLGPLRGMRLTVLFCAGIPCTDLGPLHETALTTLSLNGMAVAELGPLRGLHLTVLHCISTKVEDLSPLQGMQLAEFSCSNTPVVDLSPLRGTRLHSLVCSGTRVVDLAPLKGMQLAELNCGYTGVKDLTPLGGMPLHTLECMHTQVANLAPLKDMPMAHLGCAETKVSDLSPLKGMRLTYLDVHSTPVADLTPLAGMPLATLNCGATRVPDLSPLRGMPLTIVYFNNTPVADLEPLRGMRLTALYCSPTGVKDLSPLEGMLLRQLWCDIRTRRDLELLCSLKTLELLNERPAADVLKEAAAKPLP
jgi:serine/threonine-protein kinase